jgi:hypothetical protein
VPEVRLAGVLDDPRGIPAAPGEYDAWKERLADRGVTLIDEIAGDSGVRSCYFTAPAGNLLEIAERDKRVSARLSRFGGKATRTSGVVGVMSDEVLRFRGERVGRRIVALRFSTTLARRCLLGKQICGLHDYAH